MKRRVVVTGVGSISPLGIDTELMWSNLLACKSGVRKIDYFDASDITSQIAGALPKGAFDPDIYMSPSEQRKVDRFAVYAMAAATQAFDDSGFSDLSEEQKLRTAVIIGSGIGGVEGLYKTSVNLHENGPRRVTPFFIPSVIVNLASGCVAIKFGLKGANYSVVSACASGSHCIGEAFRQIQFGHSDFALAGGAESAICRLGVAGFAAARALSTRYNDDPEKASRPWDKGRDGFVIGEGAGVLALETYESAVKRGAKIYGEIVGYGASGDAFHITAPVVDGAGAAQAMSQAVAEAQIPVNEIGYINAHGTSTPAGDLAELRAIKKVFGANAFELNVSSTKSATGHMLGAAGAVESIICLLAMRDNVCPATLNLENPDDECDLNFTPLAPQKRPIAYAMNNSFGFGGANASLIFQKV